MVVVVTAGGEEVLGELGGLAPVGLDGERHLGHVRERVRRRRLLLQNIIFASSGYFGKARKA